MLSESAICEGCNTHERSPIDACCTVSATDARRRRRLRSAAVGHADDAIRDLAALDLGPVVIGALERDLVAGRVRDQLVEILGAERDAAVAGVVALELGGQRSTTCLPPGQ